MQRVFLNSEIQEDALLLYLMYSHVACGKIKSQHFSRFYHLAVIKTKKGREASLSFLKKKHRVC